MQTVHILSMLSHRKLLLSVSNGSICSISNISLPSLHCFCYICVVADNLLAPFIMHFFVIVCYCIIYDWYPCYTFLLAVNIIGLGLTCKITYYQLSCILFKHLKESQHQSLYPRLTLYFINSLKNDILWQIVRRIKMHTTCLLLLFQILI